MGENFRKLLKIKFSQLKVSQIVGNDGLWVWQVATPTTMRGRETTNEIELAWTRYEIAIVDRGYHVYVAVWVAAVGQILPCEWEGGNSHNPYAVVVVENSDTPIDSTLVLNENFCG